MQFESVADFLAMNGYGFFVWLSFGVAFALLFIMFIVSVYQKQQLFKQAHKEALREARVRAARAEQRSQHR